MGECFVSLRKFNVLLDVSINSEQSGASNVLQETVCTNSCEEGEIIDEKDPNQLELNSDAEAEEPSTVSDLDEPEERRIWSPVRIARLVRRIRAVGKGRIEEVTYRMLFGFNKDSGLLMCKKDHNRCSSNCAKDYIRNLNSDMMLSLIHI